MFFCMTMQNVRRGKQKLIFCRSRFHLKDEKLQVDEGSNGEYVVYVCIKNEFTYCDKNQISCEFQYLMNNLSLERTLIILLLTRKENMFTSKQQTRYF